MRALAIGMAVAVALGSSACHGSDVSDCCGSSETSSSSTAPATEPRAPRTMSLQEVADRIADADGRTLVFDANPRRMYDERHLPSARWVPYDDVTPEMLPADRGAAIVFYCGGPRCSASAHAARSALALGWKNVYVMPEGIFGWVRAGLPVEP